MKKGLKITLIVLAILLVLVVAAYFVLTGLFDFHWVDDGMFYAQNFQSRTVVVCSLPDVWNSHILHNMDEVIQIGDHVYSATQADFLLQPYPDRPTPLPKGSVVIFGNGEIWKYQPWFSDSDGSDSPESLHGLSPYWDSTVENVIILDGVTDVGEYLFWSCALKALYLPASIKTVDEHSIGSRPSEIHFQGDCPAFINDYFDDEPYQPLSWGNAERHVTIYYQPGTSGWEPACWGDYATLVEQKYTIDWSGIS